ncbi:MAG: CpsD/CapB family tyrosine-protein kinase [Bacillota bacterium]
MDKRYLEKNLLVVEDPKSITAEAFRMLRTNLQFMGVDKPLKVIAVCSSNPSEGKSTVITNLASSFAIAGSKVLLIDADLRRPQVNKIFYLENHVGLSNLLAGGLDLDSVINKTAIENLDIITSGPLPPNPAEILGSAKMEEFLNGIRPAYDMLLVDSPPVNTVADASILATKVDGMVFVIEAGKTTREAVMLAKQQLGKVNARILGVVLNKVKQVGGGYYYYYYYYNDESDAGQNKKGWLHRIFK